MSEEWLKDCLHPQAEDSSQNKSEQCESRQVSASIICVYEWSSNINVIMSDSWKQQCYISSHRNPTWWVSWNRLGNCRRSKFWYNSLSTQTLALINLVSCCGTFCKVRLLFTETVHWIIKQVLITTKTKSQCFPSLLRSLFPTNDCYS